MDRSEGISAAISRTDWETRLEQVFRSQYFRLVPILVRIVGDRQLAEELASEAMFRLSSHPAILRPGGPVEAWLYRTATNLALDALRVRVRRSRYEQAAGIEALRSSLARTPLENVLGQERQNAVRTVLAAITPRAAKVLMLRQAGFPYAEIADILQVSPASVPSIVMRAAAEFRRQFESTYGKTL